MQRMFHHMSALLIIIYLCIPVMGFANVGSPGIHVADDQSIGMAVTTPCDHCPCSDGQGTRCCDTGVCTCSFHTPPSQGVQLRYDPVVTIARYTESFWLLPQVYLSIFVPPQNQPPERFPSVIETSYKLDTFVFV